MQVAELIGCKVVFLGEQPKSRKALQLLYAAIREALTNAVRPTVVFLIIVDLDIRCCRSLFLELRKFFGKSFQRAR